MELCVEGALCTPRCLLARCVAIARHIRWSYGSRSSPPSHSTVFGSVWGQSCTNWLAKTHSTSEHPSAPLGAVIRHLRLHVVVDERSSGRSCCKAEVAVSFGNKLRLLEVQ